jgi:hypothetical protein
VFSMFVSFLLIFEKHIPFQPELTLSTLFQLPHFGKVTFPFAPPLIFCGFFWDFHSRFFVQRRAFWAIYEHRSYYGCWEKRKRSLNIKISSLKNDFLRTLISYEIMRIKQQNTFQLWSMLTKLQYSKVLSPNKLPIKVFL